MLDDFEVAWGRPSRVIRQSGTNRLSRRWLSGTCRLTFERLIAVVRDWQRRLTPDQARMATESMIGYGIVDWPQGRSPSTNAVVRGELEPVPEPPSILEGNGSALSAAGLL